MRIENNHHSCIFLVTSIIAASLLPALPAALSAQTVHTAAKGNNAVWSDSANIVGSSAFIDASAWASGGDFCAILGQAISAAPSAGAVIDARGINSSNSTLSCANSPWHGIVSPPPVTLLLPAVLISQPITISETWTLPDQTQLIGEGRLTTVIQPASGFSGDLIDMGSSSCPAGGCSAISVQHLQLGFPGGSTAVNTNSGIVNAFAQSGSYVDDVSIANLGGVGLSVSAADSGPYSNIAYGTDQPYSTNINRLCTGTDVNVCPVCVRISGPTRGLRGLTCSGDKATGRQLSPNAAAIQIQSGGNVVQDAHLEGFWDGIQVGSGSVSVNGVVISNVSSGNNATVSNPDGNFVTNTVHACGSNENLPATFGTCPSSLTQAVSDVSVLAVSNCNGVDAASVQDDVSGTTITPTANQNGSAAAACNYVGTNSPTHGSGGPGGAYVALYNLGEAVTGAGFTHFNTTIAAYTPQVGQSLFGNTLMPVWGVGDLAPTNNANAPVCQPGSLFSNTAGNHSLYVCVGGTGAGTGWQAVTTN